MTYLTRQHSWQLFGQQHNFSIFFHFAVGRSNCVRRLWTLNMDWCGCREGGWRSERLRVVWNMLLAGWDPRCCRAAQDVQVTWLAGRRETWIPGSGISLGSLPPPSTIMAHTPRGVHVSQHSPGRLVSRVWRENADWPLVLMRVPHYLLSSQIWTKAEKQGVEWRRWTELCGH